MIEIPIPREIIKHAEELAARYKFKYLKFNNRAGVIYDNDWIATVEYEYTEDGIKYYSEEDQEDKGYVYSKNDKNEDQGEDLESEEEIDEEKLSYLE